MLVFLQRIVDNKTLNSAQYAIISQYEYILFNKKLTFLLIRKPKFSTVNMTMKDNSTNKVVMVI